MLVKLKKKNKAHSLLDRGQAGLVPDEKLVIITTTRKMLPVRGPLQPTHLQGTSGLKYVKYVEYV